MKFKTLLVPTTALIAFCGCSRMESSISQTDRTDREVVVERMSEPANWEIARDSGTAQLRTEAEESSLIVEKVELPDQVRAAAEREAPGKIESAEFFEAGDTKVFVLNVDTADAPHELTIREDGVVLLNRRNPATRQVMAEERSVTVRDWRDEN